MVTSVGNHSNCWSPTSNSHFFVIQPSNTVVTLCYVHPFFWEMMLIICMRSGLKLATVFENEIQNFKLWVFHMTLIADQLLTELRGEGEGEGGRRRQRAGLWLALEGKEEEGRVG